MCPGTGKPVAHVILGLLRADLINKADDFVAVDKGVFPFSGISCQVPDIRAAKTHGHDLQDKAVFRANRLIGFFNTDIIGAIHQRCFHFHGHSLPSIADKPNIAYPRFRRQPTDFHRVAEIVFLRSAAVFCILYASLASLSPLCKGMERKAWNRDAITICWAWTAELQT